MLCAKVPILYIETLEHMHCAAISIVLYIQCSMMACHSCCRPSAALQVLVIVAASHLDAVTFQICSQSFKIMPTALFAVWLLGQYLTPMQWASLPVLAVGVVLVTMNGSAGKTQCI